MKNNAKKGMLMVSIIVAFCVIMAIVDGILKVDYLIKSIIKLVMFLILPAIYSFCDKDINIKKVFVPEKR